MFSGLKAAIPAALLALLWSWNISTMVPIALASIAAGVNPPSALRIVPDALVPQPPVFVKTRQSFRKKQVKTLANGKWGWISPSSMVGGFVCNWWPSMSALCSSFLSVGFSLKSLMAQFGRKILNNKFQPEEKAKNAEKKEKNT